MRRKEAIELGLTKYSTGKYCSHGHLSERYTNCGMCVTCSLDYAKTPKRKKQSNAYDRKRSKDPAAIEKRKLRTRKYTKKRYKEDFSFKVKLILRNNFNKVLKGERKKCSALKYLDCSVEDFKKYLQTKFEKGMTFENHGKWHLDHIKPLCLFDFSDEQQIKEALHYTNMQPLWAIDNLKKGDRY